MATTITVLSWNVESLGDGKGTLPGGTLPPQQSEIINFISLVIQGSQASLVGIMEIKSGRGALILQWLLASLNNARPVNPAYTWAGRVSSRQDGGTQEEYLFLWKNQSGVLELNLEGVPGPTSLVGVVDANAMEGLFAATGWDAAGQTQLGAALLDSGYVQNGKFKARSRMVTTSTFRVVPAAWNHLKSTGAITFAPSPATQPPPLTPTQAKWLAMQLLSIDILRFITYGDRSPYLGNFLVGGKSLMVSLLHAPGPQDPTRTDAINIMGLSLPMQAQVAQDSLLLMGDFNIGAKQGNATGRVYGRFSNNQGVFGFAQVSPVQVAQVFAPITGAPLGAPDLLPNAQTTLVNGYVADGASPASVLGNTFDKFFFRGSTTAGRQMTQSGAGVVNLVQITAANQGTAYVPSVAASALTFFRAFRGITFLKQQYNSLTALQTKGQRTVNNLSQQLSGVQTRIAAAGTLPSGSALLTRQAKLQGQLQDASGKLKVISDSVANLTTLITLVTDPSRTEPSGIGTALAVYRYAVSDHLPISVQLTA